MPFARLSALGFDVVPGSPWTVDLGARRPFAAVDELVSPAAPSPQTFDRFGSYSDTTASFTLDP